MNLELTYLNRHKNSSLEQSQAKFMKELGFIGYKRTITFFMKEIKSINGIVGHDLVTKVNCLLTNYSVSMINKTDKLFNKTVYICDVDFPAHLSFDKIKNNINEVIHSAEIKPAYAFSTSHIEYDDGTYMDFGLTMVDLTIFDQSQFAITNFSDMKGNNPIFKEIIYSNHYNPKYYTKVHAEVNQKLNESRSGNINEFVDNNTTITYNGRGFETVDTFINNIQKTGLYINKRLISSSELITDLFNKLLFISMERLEFVVDTTNPNLMMNITELKFYTSFNKNVISYYFEEICDGITKIANEYKHKFKSDFYMVIRIDEQFVMMDLHIYNTNEEFRITKPLFKLYGEFSLKNEEILNEIESTKEFIKMDYIEQISCDPDAKTRSLEDTNRMLREAISDVDNYTNRLLYYIAEAQEHRQQMIEDNVWVEKEKFLLNPPQ